MRRILLFWLLLLTVVGPLPAAETPSRTVANVATSNDEGVDFSYSPNWPQPPDTSGMLLRLGFGTFATLGLCVATLVLGRRWLQRPASHITSRKLQIEESVVLGHRATLFLVKVGESHLVAGTDAGGLKSLIVLPTTFAEILDQQVETTDGTQPISVPMPPGIVGNASRAA